jgi:very-short-patch-repair endonuclease
LLRQFLKYAETGRLDNAVASESAESDSLLEKDVLAELRQRDIKVISKIGVAGYKIDLGVLDEECPGRFICGIEFDGVAYSSCETARDRDRLRQQVLEARGWTIHRVWSTDWFKDRSGQIERLLRLIEESSQSVREELHAEREAKAHAANEAELEQQAELEPIKRAEQYVRPLAEPYVTATSLPTYPVTEFANIAHGDLVKCVVQVVEVESPIHRAELVARVAGAWNTKAGSRVQARILAACDSAEQNSLIRRKDDFYWTTTGELKIRSRAGTRITGDRIAPEEYEQAILLILAQGHSFSATQLVNEVRSVFGFSRTGPVLDEAIGAVIEKMIAEGKLGEGSAGIGLRK